MSSGDSGSEQQPNRTELGKKELCQEKLCTCQNQENLCSCFFLSRPASESTNVHPQNPRSMAGQRGRAEGAIFVLPLSLWQFGLNLFLSYLKCTFPSCTANFRVTETPVSSSIPALSQVEVQPLSLLFTFSLGAQYSPPRPLLPHKFSVPCFPFPSCLVW